MKPRNLLVAAVVLAALSGGVWWAKKHPPSASTSGAPSAAAPKVTDVPERDIRSIDLKKKRRFDSGAAERKRQVDGDGAAAVEGG